MKKNVDDAAVSLCTCLIVVWVVALLGLLADILSR